jgi:hypothetical protein
MFIVQVGRELSVLLGQSYTARIQPDGRKDLVQTVGGNHLKSTS